MTSTVFPVLAVTFDRIRRWPDLETQAFSNKHFLMMLAVTESARNFGGIRGTDETGSCWWVRIGRLQNKRQLAYEGFAVEADAVGAVANEARGVSVTGDAVTREGLPSLKHWLALLLFEFLAEEVRRTPRSKSVDLNLDELLGWATGGECQTIDVTTRESLLGAFDVLAGLQVRKVSLSLQAMDPNSAVGRPWLSYGPLKGNKIKVKLDPWFHKFIS